MCVCVNIDGPPSGRDGPKRTCMEVIKIYIKKCDLSEDLAFYKTEWRERIRVADPNIFGTRH